MMHLLTELLDIAAEADRQRLRVWYPQVLHEYPDAGDILRHCLQLPVDEVWPYLLTKVPALTLLLRLQILTPIQIAAVKEAIVFLHETLQETHHGIVKTA